MNLRFVFSGGPGAGKTALLTALAERGYESVTESARAIIQSRLKAGLSPRPSPVTFARDILRMDVTQYENTPVADKAVFFDRGVVDALGMLQQTGVLAHKEKTRCLAEYRYNTLVFMAPPWYDIYCSDSERDQKFSESVHVFEVLSTWYSECGYQISEMPRTSVDERVGFILEHIEQRHSND